MILGISILLALVLAIFWPEKESFGNFLSKELATIEGFISHSSVINDKVSQGTVGWHLGHALLVISSVYHQIESSDLSKYKRSFNFTKTLVFTINGIPRGRGKSPERVNPEDHITEEEIIDQLNKVKEVMGKFDSLDKGSYFDHLYFGMLTRSETKKFIQIHAQHHLKIVKDILKN